jgi:hypothetical protein
MRGLTRAPSPARSPSLDPGSDEPCGSCRIRCSDSRWESSFRRSSSATSVPSCGRVRPHMPHVSARCAGRRRTGGRGRGRGGDGLGSHQAVGGDRKLLHARDHPAVDGLDDVADAHLSAVRRRALLQDTGHDNLAQLVERDREAEHPHAGRRRPAPLAQAREASLQVLLGHRRGRRRRLHPSPRPPAAVVWRRQI